MSSVHDIETVDDLEERWHELICAPVAIFIGDGPGNKFKSRYFYCIERHKPDGPNCRSMKKSPFRTALFRVAEESGECSFGLPKGIKEAIRKTEMGKICRLTIFSQRFALIDFIGFRTEEDDSLLRSAVKKIKAISKKNKSSRRVLVLCTIKNKNRKKGLKAWETWEAIRKLARSDQYWRTRIRCVDERIGSPWDNYEDWIQEVSRRISSSRSRSA